MLTKVRRNRINEIRIFMRTDCATSYQKRVSDGFSKENMLKIIDAHR